MIPSDPYTPWKLWAWLVLVLIALPIACQNAQAKPILESRLNAQVRVSLHDDVCKLGAVRGGEYLRAVWVEEGKPIEGCWAYIPAARVVIFYFADFTIAAIPAQQFHRVVES